MLIKDTGGLVRDLYTNVTQPFPRIPVQTLKPLGLQAFDTLRVASVQPNAQYILFSKYVVTSTSSASTAPFAVDALFGLNASFWPALTYESSLVFLYNVAASLKQQQQNPGAADSWFLIDSMSGDGAVVSASQIASPAPLIIQTHPVLTLSNTSPGLTTSGPIRGVSCPASVFFSCTLMCSSEFSLGSSEQTFLLVAANEPNLDALSLSLVGVNTLQLAYNSVRVQVRIIPGRYNTLTCALVDLHSPVPKMQVTVNGLPVFAPFTTLDDFSRVQGLAGQLALATVAASSISLVDICCLATPTVPPEDLAKLKSLTFADTLANYFSPTGLIFGPNAARSNLVSSASALSVFTAAQSPFMLDSSGRACLQPSQVFTSSWVQSQSALLVNLSVYALGGSASEPSESVIFTWRGFEVRLRIDNLDPTRVLVTLAYPSSGGTAAVALTNVVDGIFMQLRGRVNASANGRLCTPISLTCVANNRSMFLASDTPSPATNLVVCNQPSAPHPPVGLISLRRLETVL